MKSIPALGFELHCYFRLCVLLSGWYVFSSLLPVRETVIQLAWGRGESIMLSLYDYVKLCVHVVVDEWLSQRMVVCVSD